VADTEQKDATVALLAIGRRIETARKKSRMTVAKLSAKTAISTRFIEYVEAGEFSKLPGRSHVLGFTRSICRELALDAEEIVQAVKSTMYPAPMTEFETTIAQQMKRPLVAKIANALKSVLDGIKRTKQN
jgi:cytoskeletal protein RodZ